MSPNIVSFGGVPIGKSSFSSIAVMNEGTVPATVSQVNVIGQPFSVVGVGDLPVTVPAGGNYTFYVYFSPVSLGQSAGKLMIASTAAVDGTMNVSLSGSGATASTSNALGGLVCGNVSLTGTGTDSCTVTLNTKAGTGGQEVYLYSNDPAVTLPAEVSIPAGASTLGFTATVASVSTTQTATLTATAGGVTETFALQLNAGNGAPSAPSAPVLSGLVCGNSSLTGAGADNCTVTLSGAASGGGMSINLASNNAVVTVPSAVTVPSGATSAGFTATATSVSTTEMATLTASENGASETYSLQLNPVPSAPSNPIIPVEPVLSGLVCANASITGAGTESCTVTLNGEASSGGLAIGMTSNDGAVTVPATVTVPAGAASAGFTATVASVSTTQTATLTASAGGVSEAFTVQLNVVPGAPVVPVLSGLNCANTLITGAGTDSCTLSLSAAATGTGFVVSLASNSTAVTLPATVTVPAGATTAGFTASASAVNAAQMVALTASASGVSETFALQLSVAASGLVISSTNVSFGNVVLNTPANQSITLTSSGSTPVTVSSAVLAGAGFSVSGTSLPVSLSAGQSATLNIQFDPTAAGAATGTLTIASTSLSNPAQVINLSGTGVASSYEVNLTWNAPASSTDPVAGYNVFRSPSGASSYEQLNSSVLTQTTYADPTVQNGASYNYIVESVDGSGIESTPSNTATVTIP